MTELDPAGVPSFQKTKATSSFGSLLLKSFAIFAFVGFVFFAIYWSFGRVAFEEHSRTELYGQVMRGQADVRRMAALEWATQLQSADTSNDLNALRSVLPTEEETIVLAQELKSLESTARPDVALIAGIIGVLGHSFSARGQQSLRDFLMVSRSSEWSRAQVQAVIGLSRRSPDDSQTLEVFKKIIEGNSDPSVRKAIAYGLGFQGEGEMDTETWTAKQVMLTQLLRDLEADVRWNAAFATARLGISIEPATKQIADLVSELNADLTVVPSKERSLQLSTKRSTYLEALNLVQKLEASEPLVQNMWTQIQSIALEHPDLKIRQGAKDSLKSRE
jgi:hypothetical protein